MTIHQHKTGKLILGRQEYSYEYRERDWNILGNDETENIMYTALHGTLHEMVLRDAEWKVQFPNDSRILHVCTIGTGKSFKACVEQLKKYHLLYELAQDCSSFDQAREKWYEQLKR